MALLSFEDLQQIWISQKWCFIHFSVSSTRKLKFEKSFFFFFRIAPKWYKKSWLWTIIYHLGATPEKKKQFFSNFSFPVKDTEKMNKTSFFCLYKIHNWSKFQGHTSNKTEVPSVPAATHSYNYDKIRFRKWIEHKKSNWSDWVS